MTENDVDRARAFAVAVHGPQMYGDHPYVYHLDKVADVCRRYDGVETELVICYLHDTIEDTDVTEENLSVEFDPYVAHIVDLVSNRETKFETFRRIAQDDTATFIKLCDRIANVAEGQKNDMYRRQHPAFVSALYKKGQFDSMWDELNQLLYNIGV